MKNYEKEFEKYNIEYNNDYYDPNLFGQKLKTSFPKPNDVSYSSETKTNDNNVSNNLINCRMFK